MIDHLRVEGDGGLIRVDRLKTRQIADVDFPIIGFGPSRAIPARPAGEVTELGVPAELADHMPVQRADAIDERLFAELALDRQVLERLPGRCGDHTGTLGQIGIAAGLLGATRRRWGGLFHTECISAVIGHIDPGERGKLQACFRPTLRTIPAHVEAIGVLTAFGHETRIKGEDVLVALGSNLDDGGVVEGDTINVTRTPPCKGPLMVRTLTAHMTERHAAWQHSQQPHHVTQKFLWGFLGGFPAHQYTIKQPHGLFSFQVEVDTQP